MKLAIDGGEPVRRRPMPRGKKTGPCELKELVDVIDSGQLGRWGGTKVEEFEREFAALVGAAHAVACTSGTASIHLAVGALNPSPGDEIVTGPITDIGTVIPILYQTAVPVFCDLDPRTYNMDPACLERCISPRTKAIVVVHLFGSPSDMEAILEIGRRHGIPVVEDCSQAHLAEYRGEIVGRAGAAGCFSLQQSKHITTGDGGVTVTDDEELYRRIQLHSDKGWHRAQFGPRHYSVLGLNYRMTELQGAVALAQTRRARDVVERRRRNGELLTSLIEAAEWIRPQQMLEGCRASYWLYAFTVQPHAPFSADEFAAALKAEGIGGGAHYIGKPIYLCHEAVAARRVFGDSSFPWDHARPEIRYDETTCPAAQQILDRLITLPLDEHWDDEAVRDAAEALLKVDRLLGR